MLEITVLGWLFIPITLLLAFWPRRTWLIYWTVILAAFEGASVVNFQLGDPRGLQPGYFAVLVLLGREFTLALAAGRFRYNPEILRIYAPLITFAVLAVVSAWVLPQVFKGMMVLPPRAGLGVANLAPLAPSVTNLSQALYLPVLVLVALVISHSPITLKGFACAYMTAGSLALAAGLYQVAAAHSGVPYPAEVLNSNPGYAQLGLVQSIAGVKRLSGLLREPSNAAYFLTGFLAFVTLYHFQTRSLWTFCLSLLTLLALLLTLSATAASVLFILGLWGFWLFLRRLVLNRFSMTAVTWVWTVVTLGYFAAVALFLWGGLAQALAAFDAALLTKVASGSFKTRMGSDLHSLGIVWQTWGLGVGWGSNRPSSLLMYVLSNAGVWGAFLLLVFARRVYRACRNPLATPLAASILAMLIAGVVALPDPNHLIFWVTLAALIRMRPNPY